MSTSLNDFSTLLKSMWKPLAALFFVILLISWVWGFFNQGSLRLSVSPTPAGILIDRNAYTITQTAEFNLSPGNHQIVVRRDGYLDYKTTIKISSRTTTELKIDLIKPPQKIASPGRFPALSLDGSGIYYLGGDERLYLSGLDGSNPKSVKDIVFSGAAYLSLSPDRSKILVIIPHHKTKLQSLKSPFFSSSDQDRVLIAWIYDLSSGKVTKVAPTDAATWSFDGQSVFYASYDTDPGIYQLSIAAGSIRKVTTFQESGVVIRPSPDGKYLAWYSVASEANKPAINLITLSDFSQKILVAGSSAQGAGWSPNSSVILVNTVEKEDKVVLNLVSVSSGVLKPLVSGGGSSSSVWMSSGKEFYTFDFYTKSINRINIETNLSEEVVKIERGTPSDMILGPSGKGLFYVLEGSLYALR